MVRIIAAPHDAIDTDGAHRVGIGKRGKARAHITVAGEVGARSFGQHAVGGHHKFADAAIDHLVVQPVHALQHGWHPCATLLGEHEPKLRKALEHAGHREVPQRTVCEEGCLENEHGGGRFVASIVGYATAASVMGDGQREFFAERPQWVVLAREQRIDPWRIGRDAWQQNAGETVLLGPAHIVERGIDIVEQNLGESGALIGCLRAEIGQPTVVCTQPCEAEVEVVSRRSRSNDCASWEEGRDGVGEQDLGNHAVGMKVVEAPVAVPVARAAVVLQVTKWVAVAPAPFVELLKILRLKVGAVLIGAATRMSVGRDQCVTAHCVQGRTFLLAAGDGNKRRYYRAGSLALTIRALQKRAGQHNDD